MTWPNITLVAPTAHAAGSERALHALAVGLQGEGVSVTAAVAGEGPLVRWLTDADVRVLRLPALRVRNVQSLVHASRRIRRSNGREPFVVVGSGAKGHLVGTLAARGGRGAAFWWQHGTPDRSWPERLAAARPAAGVVAVSAFVAERHRAAYRNAKVSCIHPGLQLDDVRRHRGEGDRIRARLGWGAAPIVGVVGRLQRWKGQDAFVRMAAALANETPGARFVIVGGAVGETRDDYEAELRQLAKASDLGDRIHFSGHVDEACQWIDAMDIVVNTSVEEPFGLVVLEAMALGKPAVAWRSGGPVEIIEDGRSGSLVPVRDEAALLAAVRAMLSDGSRRREMGADAAARAERFDVAVMTGQFLDLVDRVWKPNGLEEPGPG